MKLFKEFLLEITQKEAEDFLGLSNNWTQDDVEKAYKKLSLKYHPDKGGDVKDMQKLNAARKTLKKKKSSSKFDWDSLNKEYDTLKQQIQIELENKFHPEDFIAYFKKVFPTNTFTFKVERPWKNNHYAGVKFKFQNKRKDKAFEVDIFANLTDVKQTKEMLANSSDISYPVSIYAYGYTNKKKIKVFSHDYKKSNKHGEIKPETIFPKAKITKKQTRKFSKRDMLLFMKNETNSIISGDNYFIPTKDGLYVRIYRSVIMRQPIWTASGIYEKNGKWKWDLKHNFTKTMEETTETADIIKSWNKKTANKIKTELT
jgi:curved DNA-binding protein CbpA